jgi:energy-converting hydrogenase Eha subunit A
LHVFTKKELYTMPHPYFSHGATAFALIPGLIGINILLNPGGMMKAVQFPVPADAPNRTLSFTLMRMFGIRNVAVSTMAMLIRSTGDERLFGFSLILLASLAFFDGAMSKLLIGHSEWNHWVVVPILGGLSAGLLGYF